MITTFTLFVVIGQRLDTRCRLVLQQLVGAIHIFGGMSPRGIRWYRPNPILSVDQQITGECFDGFPRSLSRFVPRIPTCLPRKEQWGHDPHDPHDTNEILQTHRQHNQVFLEVACQQLPNAHSANYTHIAE